MLVEELIKQCEELLRESRFAAAALACDRALEAKASKSARCRLLLLKAEAVVAEDGRWGGPVIACLREALDLAGDDMELKARALVGCTAGYAALGSINHCRRHRDAYVQLMKSSPSAVLTKFYPRVEYNLAYANHEADRLDEAEDAYLLTRRACQQSEDPETKARIPYIDHNLIDVFQEIGRHEEAKSLMDMSYPKLPENTFGAQIRNRRAIYALHAGDLDAAILWVESGLGHESCDTKTRAALTLTKAKVVLAHSQEVAARDYATSAMRLAAAARSSRLCSRVLCFIKELEEGV